MSKSLYGYLRDQWKVPKSNDEKRDAYQARLIQWRTEPVVTRVEYPTRLDRARALGYKAKQGITIARTRVRRGSLNKIRFDGGRVPSSMGVRKITASKSLQRIAEERVGKKHPNMEVLNSYWVGEDGRHKFYEVILVDRSHPAILADKNLKWVANPGNHKRVQRGKTSAGQKGRGLRAKGMGHEKNRPSIRAHDNKRQ